MDCGRKGRATSLTEFYSFERYHNDFILVVF